jgi:hypothetical protein
MLNYEFNILIIPQRYRFPPTLEITSLPKT